MLQDYKLGFRMLSKYPGLTLAGGLALAIAIGIGAGWYDVIGQIFAPTIPLPEGDRVVLIETQNTLTNQREPRLLTTSWNGGAGCERSRAWAPTARTRETSSSATPLPSRSRWRS